MSTDRGRCQSYQEVGNLGIIPQLLTRGFCTGSPLNGAIQDGGQSPYLWYCISQKSGLAGAPSNMVDRVLCPIQHGRQKILCHDPKINQYGGPNLLRETYIKGDPQLLRGQSNKDTELRTLSYRRLYQTNQLSSRQNL